MANPAIDTFAKLGMGTANPTTEGFEFVTCGLKKRQSHAYTEGLRGTRERFAHRARVAREEVSGPIVLEPTVTELDRLWTRILGGTTAAGITPVAETIPDFFVQVDKVTKVFTYAGCRVSRFTLNATSGGIVRVTLDIEAETEAEGNAGTFPVLALDTENIFICSDIVLTINSIVVPFGAVTLIVDNLLQSDRYLNSVTRAEIPALDRMVSLQVGNAPYDVDVEPLYDAAVAGFAGSLVMVGNGVTYTFNFGNLKIPAEGPEVGGRREITLPLNLRSFKSGANDSIKVTKT